jgi:hypothetical protein
MTIERLMILGACIWLALLLIFVWALARGGGGR